MKKGLIMNQTTINQKSRNMLKILVLCGIFSTFLYAGTDILASTLWNGYSYNSQSVSELIAINAPTRPLVVPLFLIYSLLVFAFGSGVWIFSGRRITLRLAGAFMIGKEVLGAVVTLFFPIHLRGTGATYTDTMHIMLTGIGVVFMMLAIGFASAAFGWRFRVYSIITIVAMFFFGMTAGLYASPRFAAGLTTPWLGIMERINIFSFFIWVNVLSIILLKANNSGRLLRLDGN